MLASTLDSDQRVIAHMEGRSERKWKTLRDIGSSQPESDTVSSWEEENVVEEPAPLAEADTPGEGETGGESIREETRRVLIAYPSAPTTRLLRETLENFTDAQVETTSSAVRAFELALQKRYRLFFFALEMEDLNGPILYELISKVYSTGHGPESLAPGVVFIRENREETVPEELARDVRIKDVIAKPIRIERLLQAVKGVFEVRDPTTGPAE